MSRAPAPAAGRLRILQVSTAYELGGAEAVARHLHAAYRERGHDTMLAVGAAGAATRDEGVFELRGDSPPERWAHLCEALAARAGEGSGSIAARALAGPIGQPGRWVSRKRGREWFGFPASRMLLERAPLLPHVVHGHNLHGAFLPGGGYFDLRALPQLSHELPVLLTLHDAWLTTGHCAQSLGCDRWRTGCGSCPDLTLYAPLERDGTAANWRRKRDILQRSRLRVATPSAWLMRKVEDSIVAAGCVERRVIPNGVDTSVFAPGDRLEAAHRLGLPDDAHVLVAVANEIRTNRWKDYPTLEAATARLPGEIGDGRPVVVLAVGTDADPVRFDGAELRFVPGVTSAQAVAGILRAAHVFLHPTRVDTFPTTVLEALACGVPVVATAVGGVPEQVRPLEGPDGAAGAATGALVPASDAAALAATAARLCRDPGLRDALAANAAADARARFGLDRQATAYLDWYAELLASDRARS